MISVANITNFTLEELLRYASFGDFDDHLKEVLAEIETRFHSNSESFSSFEELTDRIDELESDVDDKDHEISDLEDSLEIHKAMLGLPDNWVVGKDVNGDLLISQSEIAEVHKISANDSTPEVRKVYELLTAIFEKQVLDLDAGHDEISIDKEGCHDTPSIPEC